jgi:Tat protein translocase TatB subunit
MFGIGMPEVLLILAVALIILGPKKLPEIAKTLGKAFGEFKRSIDDFKDSIDVDTNSDNKNKKSDHEALKAKKDTEDE